MTPAPECAKLAARHGFALMLSDCQSTFTARPVREGATMPPDVVAKLKQSKANIVAWLRGDEETCHRCGCRAYQAIRPYGCMINSQCPYRTKVPPTNGKLADQDGKFLELEQYNAQCKAASTAREDHQKAAAAEKTKQKQKRQAGAFV